MNVNGLCGIQIADTLILQMIDDAFFIQLLLRRFGGGVSILSKHFSELFTIFAQQLSCHFQIQFLFFSILAEHELKVKRFLGNTSWRGQKNKLSTSRTWQ